MLGVQAKFARDEAASGRFVAAQFTETAFGRMAAQENADWLDWVESTSSQDEEAAVRGHQGAEGLLIVGFQPDSTNQANGWIGRILPVSVRAE